MSPVLVTPKVQSYIDPINGGCNVVDGIDTATNQIIGRTSPGFVNTYQRFYFPTGQAIGSAFDGSGAGFTFRQNETTCVFNQPYGAQLISAKDGNTNNVGICWLDPTTDPWTVVGEWGTANANPDFPGSNIPNWFGICTITTKSARWVVTGNSPFGSITPLQTFPDGSISPPDIPFQYVAGGSWTMLLTAGPESDTKATAYFLQSPISVGNYTLGRVVVTDTTEINWSAEPIKTYTPADFVTGGITWVRFTSVALDHTDKNLIAYVAVGDSLINHYYIVKFNSSTGDIMWQVPVSGGPGAENVGLMSRAVIKNSRFFWFGYFGNGSPVDLHVIDTSTGTDTVLLDSSLGTALSCANQISNDQINGIVCFANWNSGAGTIQLLNSTPSSGASLAAVYFIEDSPTHDHIFVCPDPVTTE